MMKIDLTKLELPKDWQEKAEKAYKEIESLAPADRAKAINESASIWSDLKEALKKLSGGKCWYCESRQSRSDNAVDHFRPKNRILEDPAHGGYWWLAFDYENYRFTCTFCNSRRKDPTTGESGGKHDHFPIIQNTKRAQCKAEIAFEMPCLLDPTCDGEAEILWYTDKGDVEPKYKESPILAERANTSIHLYHLKHTNLVEDRIRLFNLITRKVVDGKLYFDRYAQQGDATAKRALEGIIVDLRELTNRRASHSSAARAYVLGKYQEGNEWLQAVIRSMDVNGDL